MNHEIHCENDVLTQLLALVVLEEDVPSSKFMDDQVREDLPIEYILLNPKKVSSLEICSLQMCEISCHSAHIKVQFFLFSSL